MTAKFGFEDQLVAAGYSDGHVKVYNINTKKIISDLNPCQNLKDNGPINTLKWRPSN
jgi:WD40 repeat protein